MGVRARRRDADGGRLWRFARGVGEQVREHLRDAPPVGHHRGQVRRQVDGHGVMRAAAQERATRALDQVGHRRGLGRDRERARLDPPGIQEFGDEGAHAIGLLGDQAVELARLGRVECWRLLQKRGGRALDGDQRRAQFVADQPP